MKVCLKLKIEQMEKDAQQQSQQRNQYENY